MHFYRMRRGGEGERDTKVVFSVGRFFSFSAGRMLPVFRPGVYSVLIDARFEIRGPGDFMQIF